MINLDDEYSAAQNKTIEIEGKFYSTVALLAAADPDRLSELMEEFAFKKVDCGEWVKIDDGHYEDRIDYEIDLVPEPLDFSGCGDGER